MMRLKLNILGTKVDFDVGRVGECEKSLWRKKKKKAGLKREKGAVIYVRVMENNAGGRRGTKVSLLCVLGLNKTPGCLLEEGRTG